MEYSSGLHETTVEGFRGLVKNKTYLLLRIIIDIT